MGVEIRPVRPQECEEVGRLTVDAYREHAPSVGSWDGYMRRLADVGSRADVATVLVAVVDGVIAGTATLELSSRIPSTNQGPLAEDEAHLRMVAVSRSQRRRGVGRRLVDACIEQARGAGKRRLTLDTTERMTAACRMYEAMGFQHVGVSDRIPSECMLMYELRLD